MEKEKKERKFLLLLILQTSHFLQMKNENRTFE